MDFTQEKASDGVAITMRGAFTFKDHHSFRELLDTIKASAGRHHVLDLSRLDFMDSAALGMLLIADDESKSGGWTLTLRHPPSRIARLIELAAMDEIFKIEP